MGDTNKLSSSEYKISTARIRKFEIQEALSWAAYFQDIPDDLSTKLGIRIMSTKNAVGTSAARIDILAFNRVSGLGLDPVVTEQEIGVESGICLKMLQDVKIKEKFAIFIKGRL